MCRLFGCLRSDLIEDREIPRGKNHSKGIVINVYDHVTAGIPIDDAQNIIDTEEIPEEMSRSGEFFGLRIKGNSMDPDIRDGDTVIIRRQSDAESSEIVIAQVNQNNGVCKRLKKYADSLALLSMNPSYEPMYFSQQEIDAKAVQILGKVVELRRKM